MLADEGTVAQHSIYPAKRLATISVMSSCCSPGLNAGLRQQSPRASLRKTFPMPPQRSDQPPFAEFLFRIVERFSDAIGVEWRGCHRRAAAARQSNNSIPGTVPTPWPWNRAVRACYRSAEEERKDARNWRTASGLIDRHTRRKRALRTRSQPYFRKRADSPNAGSAAADPER